MTTTVSSSTVRAGDGERAATADVLGQGLTQGYLDMPEYEQRVAAAFAAHSTNELRQLVADLPIAQLRRNDPRRRAARDAAARMSVRLHLAAYVVMVVIVLTVWLAVAGRRDLVLLAGLADPRRRHRRTRTCDSDQARDADVTLTGSETGAGEGVRGILRSMQRLNDRRIPTA